MGLQRDDLGGRYRESLGSVAAAAGRKAPGVRRTDWRGPWRGDQRGWPVQPGSASATGSHGSWPADGCSAERCACSRGLQDSGRAGQAGRNSHERLTGQSRRSATSGRPRNDMGMRQQPSIAASSRYGPGHAWVNRPATGSRWLLGTNDRSEHQRGAGRPSQGLGTAACRSCTLLLASTSPFHDHVPERPCHPTATRAPPSTRQGHPSGKAAHGCPEAIALPTTCELPCG